MTCTLDDASGVRSGSGDVVLGGGAPLTSTIDNLPTGATCTFEETVAQGAVATTISPTSVVVGDATVVTVTITNDFAFPPAPPPEPPPPSVLPATGWPAQPLIGLAMLLVLVGLTIHGSSTRRTRRRKTP